MYVHDVGIFIGPPAPDLNDYKADIARFTALQFRRANRFVFLTLAGACRCAGGKALETETGVYLTTENGNLSDTEAVLHQIYHRHEFPMPYNFINTMSNTAAFYVAQTLGLSGRNITFSSRQLSFERGLELLRCDLEGGAVSAGLIGGVDEAAFSPAQFSAKFGRSAEAYALVEGSCWLRVTGQKAGALGMIREIRSFPEGTAAAAWLEQQSWPLPVTLAWGLLVEEEAKAFFRRFLPEARELDYIQRDGWFDSAAAGCVAAFLQQGDGLLVHVNFDLTGRCMVLVVEKY